MLKEMMPSGLKGFHLVAVIVAAIAFVLSLQEKSLKDSVVINNNVIKYWPYMQTMWNKNDNLRTVKQVFDRSGHQRVDESQDWDVMWSLEYPFDIFPDQMKSLKPHQRVNHFPGMGFLGSKAYMVTHNFYPFIPAAFEFPMMVQEFNSFIAKYPNKKFVQKNVEHRGVKVVGIEQIDFANTSQRFYQEFIENPLLIDGHAFDFGVYVLIASINPLRLYRFDSEALIRFCPEPYHPFDPENIQKYVVESNHKTLKDMPSFKETALNLNASFKSLFEHFLQSKDFDMVKLWKQIDHAIVSLVFDNEENIIIETKQFGDPEQFFELLRFDFILDQNLGVHLMEVNMSPNLTPASVFYEVHGPSYTKVVHNALQCAVGIENGEEFDVEQFNLTINREFCSEKTDEDDCGHSNRQICSDCLDVTEIKKLRRAFQENTRKGDWNRVFPSSNHFNDEFIEKLSPENQLMTKWYRSNCAKDHEWC